MVTSDHRNAILKVWCGDLCVNIYGDCGGLYRQKVEQTGPDRHSTVESLMANRHCCIMFMDALQTEETLTARLNSFISKFIEKEMERLKRKEKSVHVLQQRCDRLSPQTAGVCPLTARSL